MEKLLSLMCDAARALGLAHVALAQGDTKAALKRLAEVRAEIGAITNELNRRATAAR